jgi:hypothetical protein
MPLLMNTSVRIDDVINRVSFDSDYHGKYKHNADGAKTIQYEVVENQVLKIPFKPGYPKKIKMQKFYTLTLYFDTDCYSTGYKIKKNPNSPFLRKDFKRP